MMIVINMFLLSSCWNYVEIDQQINVSGFAIDVGQMGKKFHLSAEIITVGKEGTEEITASVIETDADTLFEGVRNLMLLTSKKLYFGHCKVLIVGEEAAKQGIGEIIDLPIRNHEMRISMELMIAKNGKGKDILFSEGLSIPVVAYKLYDLTKAFSKSVGESLTPEIYKVYNSIQAEGQSTVVPALELSKVEDELFPRLVGGAVFCEDKLNGYLDEIETKNLSILKSKLRTGLVTIEDPEKPGDFQSFEIYKIKANTKLECNEKPKVKITVSSSVIIGEVQNNEDFMNLDGIEMMKKELEEGTKEQYYALIRTAQKDLKCDVFGIGTMMQREYPKVWEKYRDDWNKTFETLQIDLQCEIKITGSGTNNRTANNLV